MNLQNVNAWGVAVAARERRCADLEDIFARCFFGDYATRLLAAPVEPLYLPAVQPGECHRIFYLEGHFSSALHEVAHWCIAGPRRRLCEDYGYWYVPDGRGAAEQRRFEQVEVRPQALESVFAQGCAHRFHISADNLQGAVGPDSRFADAVREQVEAFGRLGLPQRAATFYRALCRYYGTCERYVGRSRGVELS